MDKELREKLENCALEDAHMTLFGVEAKAILAERAQLLEALAPFARAGKIDLLGKPEAGGHFGRTKVSDDLTFGDLWRARDMWDRGNV